MLKRAHTPLTQINNNTSSSLSINRTNLLANNIQVTGIRFNNDETSSSKSYFRAKKLIDSLSVVIIFVLYIYLSSFRNYNKCVNK